MAPPSKSSTSPAPKKTRGLQVKPKAAKLGAKPRAKMEAQVSWYGGENTNQDVSISLVCSNTVNGEEHDNHTLAKLMVHKSRLNTCSRYFGAGTSDEWNEAKSESLDSKEFTIHVDGDVQLYIDCFSRMYSPFTVGFTTVIYSLQLLAVATHLACDELMSSICRYLAVRPWADDDEMRIRCAVSSEDFPRGHAKDLLKRLEMRQCAQELRPFIKRCMNSSRSSGEAKELLSHVLRTARVQDQIPIPTFEQEVVRMINEEFKLLLLETKRRIAAARNKGSLNARIHMDMESNLHGVLHVLIETDMAEEGVRWFFLYHPFLRLPPDQRASERNEHVVSAVTKLAGMYVGLVWAKLTQSPFLSAFNIIPREIARNTMLINLLPLLDWLYRNGDRIFGGNLSIFRLKFEGLKGILPSHTPYSQELQEIVNRVLAP